jgi:hypothetical protein
LTPAVDQHTVRGSSGIRRFPAAARICGLLLPVFSYGMSNMFREVPIILCVLAIVGLTYAESRISGRFEGSDLSEDQFTAMLKNVPDDIGDWHGEDLPVDETVRKTAGARGYVSRAYRNASTGDEVKLWLIVGHSKDIVRHTPDICYPSSGFKKRADENSKQPFIFEGQKEADFYTNTFLKEDASGRQVVRVFWSWYKPNTDHAVTWEAPTNVRWQFGNARSLYKMYFTSVMKDTKETTDQSPCVKFAEQFLPVVDKALSSIKPGTPEKPVPAEESKS